MLIPQQAHNFVRDIPLNEDKRWLDLFQVQVQDLDQMLVLIDNALQICCLLLNRAYVE